MGNLRQALAQSWRRLRLAGRTDAGVFSISIVEAQVREGSLRALAVAANKRISAFPDLPTAAETIPGFDFGGWFMLMAPAGTPPGAIETLRAGTARALKSAELAPATSRVLGEAVAKHFSPEILAVVHGGPELAAYFAGLPWDHLTYTGGGRVGRLRNSCHFQGGLRPECHE